MQSQNNYGIKLLVKGKYALFTRPEMKVERHSYDVMTPSAARGILEAIHWKPAIRWVIDKIEVLNPIKFQSIRRNEVKDIAQAPSFNSLKTKTSLSDMGIEIESSRAQRASNVLSDVAYIIHAHFERTKKWGPEDNEGKHLDIFNRRARSGQCFHQPCLGTREFACDFELVEGETPTPIEDNRDLGIMLWDINHGGDKSSMFFRAKLVHGVINIPQPNSAEILQ